ncbi:MAG TPA: hypothetical protein VG711_01770 [Phycisphaerales bacterium]|nr:hypothetical protein [Phycisphaerales bacterium]
MVALTSLWLPILVSAVAAFVIGSAMWMMPHHKGDSKVLPDEDGVRSALGKFGLARGVYFFPHMSSLDGKSKEERAEMMRRGPAGMLHIFESNMFAKMGRNMALILVYYVVVSAVVAYVASETLPGGTGFMRVWQIAGTVGVAAYCFAGIPYAICFSTPARNIVSAFVDGVVMGLATGAVFAWLWPTAGVVI